MPYVEFAIQNKNQRELKKVRRNWNINNIVTLILSLKEQKRNGGVVYFYVHMVDEDIYANIDDDVISVNELPMWTREVIDMTESNSASDLLETLYEVKCRDEEKEDDQLGDTGVVVSLKCGSNTIYLRCESMEVESIDPYGEDDDTQY